MFRHRFVSDPHESKIVEDTPEAWHQLLDNPDVVGDDKGKEAANVVCGARYFDEVETRDKEGVEAVTCLVLDVDHPATGGPGIGLVPSEEALRSALNGLRAIVYTSPSHTAAFPRWRVLMPLATPLPPKKHRDLIRKLSMGLVPEYPGCINVESTGDPCRLGFVCVTKHPEDYHWWSQDGVRFDWTGIQLEDETWSEAPLGGLDRQPRWTDRETALQYALKYYATVGYDGARNGEHRKIILWDVANELWWQWAAEDEDFVMTVLRSVNAQFPEAKEEEVLEERMRQAYDRTIGEKRKPQSYGPYGSRREPATSISPSAIAHLARRLKKSHKPAVARVGEELSLLEKGLALTDEPEGYKAAIARCAQELAVHFSHDRVERIVSFFVTSRGAMVRKLGDVDSAVPSLAEIDSWVRTRIEGERKRKIEQKKRTDEATRKSIESATNGKRDTKYTPEEVETWMAPNGVGLSEKTWLLQAAKGTYVFLDGTWVGPYSNEEFDAQGYTDLEAAADYVKIKGPYNEQKQTSPYLPLSELLRKHGSKCTPHIDYSCERTFFRQEDKTLVLVGPVRTSLTAQFHTQVDQWFRVMTGRSTPINEKVRRDEAAKWGENDDYDAVCNWLACFIQLEHVCAALYLQGRKHVGKGLFSDGLARIWKAGKIPLTAAFGHFNSLLTGTPYIHVDEALPPGMTASTLLRRTLAEREHVYTRKNIDSGKLTGCVRMLFTANNLDIFNAASRTEQLKKEDVEALGDRFVHVRVRNESIDYLRSIAPHQHDFVEKNMLAEHTLWLNEKRWAAIHKNDLRFLVQGQNQNVANIVATNADVTSDVCSAITEALLETRKQGWFVVRNRELWISTSLLKQHLMMRNPRLQYTERDVARAVSSVSTERAVVRTAPGLGGSGPKQIRMWSFRLDALKSWCDNTLVQDWEDVQQALDHLDDHGVGEKPVEKSWAHTTGSN